VVRIESHTLIIKGVEGVEKALKVYKFTYKIDLVSINVEGRSAKSPYSIFFLW
jgi:hypothetical protein